MKFATVVDSGLQPLFHPFQEFRLSKHRSRRRSVLVRVGTGLHTGDYFFRVVVDEVAELHLSQYIFNVPAAPPPVCFRICNGVQD